MDSEHPVRVMRPITEADVPRAVAEAGEDSDWGVPDWKAAQIFVRMLNAYRAMAPEGGAPDPLLAQAQEAQIR